MRTAHPPLQVSPRLFSRLCASIITSDQPNNVQPSISVVAHRHRAAASSPALWNVRQGLPSPSLRTKEHAFVSDDVQPL